MKMMTMKMMTMKTMTRKTIGKQLGVFGLVMCAPLMALAQGADEAPANAFDKAPGLPDTMYWSVQGGVNAMSRWPAVVDFGGPTVPAGLKIGRGVEFGVAVGKQYTKARYELEYQHGQMNIDEVTVAALTEKVDVALKYDALTVNAHRSETVSDNLTAFAGVGVGIGRVALPDAGLRSGCKCVSAASKSSLVYQVRVGMEYRLSETGFAFAQLGYLSLPGATSSGAASVTYERRAVAMLSVGYRGHFN